MKLLKKIRRIAASQKHIHSTTSVATNNLSPITFHPVHGENIRLSSNGTVANRSNSYCKGICFTNRPIQINEPVCIRIVEMSHFWSGVLRFGFTTKNPVMFRDSLPKYACPNLTNCGHTFAKALPERYAHKNCILSFRITENGSVHFSIDGVEKGIILSNIKMNGPFWALIDLYGNTTKIESLDPRLQLNNRSTNIYQNETLLSSTSMIDLPNELSREPSPQIYSSKNLELSQFHRTRGYNVRLSSNKCIAERNKNYYSHGYVFTETPLKVGVKIVIQVLKTDEMFTGSMAFGLTSCNPSHLNITDLPEDSHRLLDRSEYWVVIKDVANSPMAGDEIAFSINEKGEVIMTKNRQRPIILMHVDTSQSLWGFFDLYGSTLKIRMLGCHHSEKMNCANLKSIHSVSLHNMHKSLTKDHDFSHQYKFVESKNRHLALSNCNTIKNENQLNANKKAITSSQNTSPFHSYYDTPIDYQVSTTNRSSGSFNNTTFGNECLVCYEEPINSVFYTCGHVCMCFKCSMKQWQTSGHCPICRARIVDVIRTYWS